MSASDLELLQQAVEGDTGAFHELASRHADDLFRLAFSLVGNRQDAEDVLQETLTAAFERIGSFEKRAAVKTWLIRILVNQSARVHRSRHVRRTASLDALSEGAASVLSGAPADPSERADLRLDVMAVLEALSAEHRQVITLREFQGLSYEEIAQVLGVPRGTVESRLFRARRELRERLKAYLP